VSDSSGDGTESPQPIDVDVGRAVKEFRERKDVTIRNLAEASRVSAAMISRIENAQVSPSLATLNALAASLAVPLVSLFHHTTRSADIAHVKAGGGLPVTRFATGHRHDFRTLGKHQSDAMSFEVSMITLVRKEEDVLPSFQGEGFILIHGLDGEATFAYGDRHFALSPGDSLSFDATLRHGFVEIVTASLTYLSVWAKPQ
jgi:transcriptional regulator with XRE-family HTH domain